MVAFLTCCGAIIGDDVSSDVILIYFRKFLK